MNEKQSKQIRTLREEHKSYAAIASLLGLSENTVKSFCRRNGLTGVAVKPVLTGPVRPCLYCGADVVQTPKKKEKKFCSSFCRNKWWNSHLGEVNRKAYYSFVCPTCNKPFTKYGSKAHKYCCHACYIADRFGGDKA